MMTIVDFTKDELIAELKGVFATKEDMKELIEASELKVVKTVKETFDAYDKKLSVQRRVTRKHSADIAELVAMKGV